MGKINFVMRGKANESDYGNGKDIAEDKVCFFIHKILVIGNPTGFC